MVGTLVKTETNVGLFIGLVKEHFYCSEDVFISIEVTWNDCDETTETFNEYDDYESPPYHFYHKGRWWRVEQNFYKFLDVLEGKCK